MLLVLITLSVFSSCFFYVQAFKSGMSQKKWAVAGLMFGPTVLPLFSIKRQVKLRQFIGHGNVLIRA